MQSFLFWGLVTGPRKISSGHPTLPREPNNEEDFQPALEMKRKEDFLRFLPGKGKNITDCGRIQKFRLRLDDPRFCPTIRHPLTFSDEGDHLDDVPNHKHEGNDEEDIAN